MLLIKNKIIKLLKSRFKAREVIIEGMGKFKEYLREYWKERCEKVVEWEKSNNITNKIKRQKKDKSNTDNINNENANLNREENNIDIKVNKKGEKEKERETKQSILKFTLHSLERWVKDGSYGYNTNYCYRYYNFI
jgi:phage-related minor tail protein